MKKPLLVIVSGAPGSGKTTLASRLADYMRLPHIERDTVLRGLEFTKGTVDKAKEGVPIYYGQLKNMIDAGISLVTDGTLYKNVSEQDIKTQLVPHTIAINVHARAQNEHQRFYDREMNRRGVPKEWNKWLESHMDHLKKIYSSTVEPLDLGIPLLEVDTNDEYNPEIGEIAAQIREMYTGEPRDLWGVIPQTELQ